MDDETRAFFVSLLRDMKAIGFSVDYFQNAYFDGYEFHGLNSYQEQTMQNTYDRIRGRLIGDLQARPIIIRG